MTEWLTPAPHFPLCPSVPSLREASPKKHYPFLKPSLYLLALIFLLPALSPYAPLHVCFSLIGHISSQNINFNIGSTLLCSHREQCGIKQISNKYFRRNLWKQIARCFHNLHSEIVFRTATLNAWFSCSFIKTILSCLHDDKIAFYLNPTVKVYITWPSTMTSSDSNMKV